MQRCAKAPRPARLNEKTSPSPNFQVTLLIIGTQCLLTTCHSNVVIFDAFTYIVMECSRSLPDPV